jgi:hypothetical protein
MGALHLMNLRWFLAVPLGFGPWSVRVAVAGLPLPGVIQGLHHRLVCGLVLVARHADLAEHQITGVVVEPILSHAPPEPGCRSSRLLENVVELQAIGNDGALTVLVKNGLLAILGVPCVPVAVARFRLPTTPFLVLWRRTGVKKYQ